MNAQQGGVLTFLVASHCADMTSDNYMTIAMLCDVSCRLPL